MNLINYLPILIVTFLISSAVFLALSLILFFCFTLARQSASFAYFSRTNIGKRHRESEGCGDPDEIASSVSSPRNDGSDLQDRAYLQAFSIIQEAKRDALKVIKDSNLRAQSIIKEAHVINKKSENLLEGEIEKAADVHIKALDKVSEELLGFYKDIMVKASEGIQTAVIKDVDEFKDVLHKETMEAKQTVEKEMGEYRSRRMQEIDKKIYDIVYGVTSKVLGRSLSIADHEAVIFKILDDVKQKGGLTASENS